MFRIYLVQTGQTTWDAQSRLAPPAGAPLSEQGAARVQEAAAELAVQNSVGGIYAAGGDAEMQTARVLAQAMGLKKIRNRKDLREIDYGLWQGLTTDEIKRRQPKVYRQWRSDPASVRPPDGETLEEAQQRLMKTISQLVKKHKEGAAMLVLRPMAAALVRCGFESGPLESLWKYVGPDCAWFSYELAESSLQDLAGRPTQRTAN